MSIAFACRYYWIWATQTSPNRALAVELGLRQTFNTVLLFATFAQSSSFLHIFISHAETHSWIYLKCRDNEKYQHHSKWIPCSIFSSARTTVYIPATPHIWNLTTLIIATWAKIFWMLTKGCLSTMIRWAILFSRFTQTQTHDEWMNVMDDVFVLVLVSGGH